MSEWVPLPAVMLLLALVLPWVSTEAALELDVTALTFDCLSGLLATLWKVRALSGSVFTAVVLFFSSCLLAFATEVPAHVYVSVCMMRAHALLFCLLELLSDPLSRPRAAPSWLEYWPVLSCLAGLLVLMLLAEPLLSLFKSWQDRRSFQTIFVLGDSFTYQSASWFTPSSS